MFSNTVVTTSIAAILALGATAAGAKPTVPAAAATAAATTTATVGASAVSGIRPAADNPDQLYCVLSDITGSRIKHKQCETLADWQAMDVDPRTMKRVR